jgi:hypothetical protein
MNKVARVGAAADTRPIVEPWQWLETLNFRQYGGGKAQQWCREGSN